MSELDKDFELVKQINAKLNEAAKALKEANELRAKAGFDAFIFTNWMREELSYKFRKEGVPNAELWDKIEEEQAKFEQFDTDALESQISSAGWSTSSSYC